MYLHPPIYNMTHAHNSNYKFSLTVTSHCWHGCSSKTAYWLAMAKLNDDQYETTWLVQKFYASFFSNADQSTLVEEKTWFCFSSNLKALEIPENSLYDENDKQMDLIDFKVYSHK